MNDFEKMLVESPMEQLKKYVKTIKSSVEMEYVFKYPPIVQYEIIGVKRFEGCEATISNYSIGDDVGFYNCFVYSPIPYWHVQATVQKLHGRNLRLKESWEETRREIRQFMIDENLVKNVLISE